MSFITALIGQDVGHAMLTSGSAVSFAPFLQPVVFPPSSGLSVCPPFLVLYTIPHAGQRARSRLAAAMEKVQSWSAAVDRRRRPRPTPLTLHFRHLMCNNKQGSRDASEVWTIFDDCHVWNTLMPIFVKICDAGGRFVVFAQSPSLKGECQTVRQ